MPFSHDAEIPFTKMTGSGNDFVVIDHRAPLFDPGEVAEFTRAVCRRGLGIGADGVVLIEDAGDEEVDFRWRYINADGSDGEMCGNGAMCGARYAVLHEIAASPTRFLTPDGVVTAVVENPHEPAVRIAVSYPGPIRRVAIEIEPV